MNHPGPYLFLCAVKHFRLSTFRHPWTNDAHAFQITAAREGMHSAPTADLAIFRMPTPIVEISGEVELEAVGSTFSTEAAHRSQSVDESRSVSRVDATKKPGRRAPGFFASSGYSLWK